MSLNLPFDSIKEFRINELIHEGPYTRVFRGWQSNLKRDILVKLLKPSASLELKKRFEREARVYARLSHPNIVSVFDFGEKEKYLFIILEYVHGINLNTLLKNNENLTYDVVYEIGSAVLQALKHSAKKNVVHRDIKPANILIDREGRIKVADFGLALIGDEPNLTQPEMMIGTPAYMSPEQITGDAVDERSDLFSFGSLLYELLFKEQAFGSENYSTCLNNILNETPSFLSKEPEDIPEQLISFLKKCLQKQRKERPGNVAEAIKMWDKIQTGPRDYPSAYLLNSVQKFAENDQKTKSAAAREKPQRKPNYQKAFLAVSILLFIVFIIWILSGENEINPQVAAVVEDSTKNQNPKASDNINNKDSLLSDTVVALTSTLKKSAEPTRQITPAVLIKEKETIKPEAKSLPMSRLDLIITPWAKVYLDDVLIDTHLVKKQIILTAGEHTLTFEHPRFSSETQTVSFSPGELTQVQWSFWNKTGFLKLEVRPWAHIYINDEFYDTTPVNKPIRIPAGQKILELRHPSLQNHRQIIEIKAADTLSLKVSLQSKAGTVIE